MNNFEHKVVQCKNDKNNSLRKEIINYYKPIIIKNVSSITGRYITSEDSADFEMGLEAFNEAIDKYERGKGSFVNFAEGIIKTKVNSYLHKDLENQEFKTVENIHSREVVYPINNTLTLHKGIVKDVRKNHSVVETDKQTFKVINKLDMEAGQDIMFTNEDIMMKKSTSPKRGMYISAAFAAVFLIVFTIIYQINVSSYNVYAQVAVDINPSAMLDLDEYNKVIGVTLMNDDAGSLGDLELKGLKAEDAVITIIEKAYDKGFIDEGKEAYVLITTIPLKSDGAKMTQKINIGIGKKLKENDELKNIKIATIQATKAVNDEAKDKNIPTGIYTLKGKVDLEKYSTVKNFFTNEGNIELLKENGGTITSVQEDKTEDEKTEETVEDNLVEPINPENEVNIQGMIPNEQVENNQAVTSEYPNGPTQTEVKPNVKPITKPTATTPKVEKAPPKQVTPPATVTPPSVPQSENTPINSATPPSTEKPANNGTTDIGATQTEQPKPETPKTESTQPNTTNTTETQPENTETPKIEDTNKPIQETEPKTEDAPVAMAG